MLIREPHAHAVAEKLHSGDHHHVAGMQPLCDTPSSAKPATVTSILRTRLPAGSTTNTAELPSLSVSAVSGTTIAADSSSMRSVTDAVMPSRMIGGGPFTVMRTA